MNADSSPTPNVSSACPGARTRPAVVLGLCSHGLAAVRSLHRQGVEVYALEANSALPGVHTALARVVMTSDINGPGLIDALLALHASDLAAREAVIIAVNDNMVRTLAEGWARLEGRYRLSWSTCRARVLELLDKARLEARCRDQGLSYPPSAMLSGRGDIERVMRLLEFPLLIKPTRPLSRFKAVRVSSTAELEALVERHGGDLPFLAQRWVAGGDERLVFGALYLADGRVEARFEGRKLRSFPRAMGQTTAAVNAPADDVHAETVRFFDGLRLSGPVSLEMKRDGEGKLWVIEPTVGRTDFWLECCIANGVDLVALEYRHASGQAIPASRQHPRAVWLDSEREPTLWPRLLLEPSAEIRGLRPVFSYCHRDDLGPFIAGLRAQARRAWRGIVRRLAPGGRGEGAR